MEIILRFGVLAYGMAISTTLAAPIQKMSEAKDFLSQYGYYSSPSSSQSLSISNMLINQDHNVNTVSSAVMNFQRFYGLNVTGELDSDTLRLMSLPRCGVKDDFEAEGKSYYLFGYQHNKHVTYKITKYSEHIDRETVEKEIKKAFEVWSEHTDLKFKQKEETPVDIEIQFLRGPHSKHCDPFDGLGKFLAHAGYSYIHFDDDENWTVASMMGTNFLQVAAHEIGHSLGLGHSNHKSALMFASYSGYEPSFRLDVDDIKGIQAIYGKRTEGPVLRPVPPPVLPPVVRYQPPTTRPVYINKNSDDCCGCCC